MEGVKMLAILSFSVLVAMVTRAITEVPYPTETQTAITLSNNKTKQNQNKKKKIFA